MMALASKGCAGRPNQPGGDPRTAMRPLGHVQAQLLKLAPRDVPLSKLGQPHATHHLQLMEFWA